MNTQSLFAEHALLPTGWARDVLLSWNDHGVITGVKAQATCPEGTARATGPVLPGMPNLHSHAFQRAFGGLTEYRGATQDSFWSWRSLMYRFAAAITPEQLEAIATGLYVEMLEAGYTSVCEFHYVHHDSDGRPYADDAALTMCLLRAAARSGMGLTLLPVLYQTSGFGSTPPSIGQQRFIRSTDNMLALLQKLKPLCEAQGARLGLAPHSLRAVPPGSLREALAALPVLGKDRNDKHAFLGLVDCVIRFAPDLVLMPVTPRHIRQDNGPVTWELTTKNKATGRILSEAEV